MLPPQAGLREYVLMDLKYEQTGSLAIVYDADQVAQAGEHLFDPVYWQKNNAITRTASGRGNALMLATPFGPAVLRTYLRGGWAARLSHNRYIFTGFERSRPVSELRVLASLWSRGLPVPQPLAAFCRRHGLTYSGALLTRCISNARTLADQMEDLAPGHPGWFLVGACIRKFHDAGVIHPDLNARNILLCERNGEVGQAFLVDFDRASLRLARKSDCKRNLDRLDRSLRKMWPVLNRDRLAECWAELIKGYNESHSTNRKNDLA